MHQSTFRKGEGRHLGWHVASCEFPYQIPLTRAFLPSLWSLQCPRVTDITHCCHPAALCPLPTVPMRVLTQIILPETPGQGASERWSLLHIPATDVLGVSQRSLSRKVPFSLGTGDAFRGPTPPPSMKYLHFLLCTSTALIESICKSEISF